MKKMDDARIGRLLGAAYSLWQRETYQALVEMGFEEVRPSHSPVFRYVEPEGTRIGDLADRAGMTKQSMAYLVRSMEDRSLAHVQADPEDGRARLVVLTARGCAAAAALIDASLRAEGAMTQRFGNSEVEVMRQSLSALVRWNFEGD